MNKKVEKKESKKKEKVTITPVTDNKIPKICRKEYLYFLMKIQVNSQQKRIVLLFIING